jgi:hypothetical protein
LKANSRDLPELQARELDRPVHYEKIIKTSALRSLRPLFAHSATIVMSGGTQNMDVVVLDRRRDIRIIVSLAARVFLKRGPGGGLIEYACRAINLSVRAVAFAAPVRTTLGEWVRAEIETVGRIEGKVERLLDERGFVVGIEATDEQRARLADKILWAEKHKDLEVSDKRKHPRFVPSKPHSIIVFADGTMADCFVIDLSISGAAIATEVTPPIGTVLAVGRVVGRVVRHFAGAFAVEFVQLQNRETLESMAIVK